MGYQMTQENFHTWGTEYPRKISIHGVPNILGNFAYMGYRISQENLHAWGTEYPRKICIHRVPNILGNFACMGYRISQEIQCPGCSISWLRRGFQILWRDTIFPRKNFTEMPYFLGCQIAEFSRRDRRDGTSRLLPVRLQVLEYYSAYQCVTLGLASHAAVDQRPILLGQTVWPCESTGMLLAESLKHGLPGV